ncbi:MAG: hypothetical protein WC781_03525 [Candidatus Pacearchaeota archaeon]|jgi:hypothetical protein
MREEKWRDITRKFEDDDEIYLAFLRGIICKGEIIDYGNSKELIIGVEVRGEYNGELISIKQHYFDKVFFDSIDVFHYTIDDSKYDKKLEAENKQDHSTNYLIHREKLREKGLWIEQGVKENKEGEK